MTNPTNDLEALAAARKIYISGHSEGWTGNQMRRDVQHVDAEKGWELYVQNGALDKVLTALHTQDAAPVMQKPKVHHLGAALQAIADNHADILTPRETEALYQAASKLWVDEP